METTKLRRFAQYARRTLMELVEARLQLVLQPGSAARRENAEAIKKLEEAINERGEAQVIERVAYTWFNRFCALRFMDVNRYTRIGVVSPAEGQFQPEILAEAKMGHIDDEMVPESSSSKMRQQIFALLEDKSPSHDPQGEAYRLLVVAACNAFHRAMPFLFERIDDYTELLMPDDLLSGNSILAYTREAMTPDDCKDKTTGEPIVEVIGWLYQFYISEKKDAVFEGLKKNQKITPENIPAATQLFTPHWIVRYLVENSLGRLWMLNRPSSRLAEKMDYYIKPEQPETDFLKISGPEEIKICDPACGSGHMLTYAFDLLYAIYEEEGVDAAEIPEKILTHNLHGIEIDERAGELAAFALTMKARAKQRRFFNKGIKPNICVLENVKFDADELIEYKDFIGRDLFTAPLRTTLRQFEEADNFGSLIRPELTDVQGILNFLEAKDVSGQLFLFETHKKAIQALKQADYLSPKYQVVIANPPYMGSRNMNSRLVDWVKENYQNSKSDSFAMFIERNIELCVDYGFVAMITMQSWMFLSAHEELRLKILTQSTLISMAHLGSRAFDSIGGEVVSTSAFVLENRFRSNYLGTYIRLVDGNSEQEKDSAIRLAIGSDRSKLLFHSSADAFKEIPGSPIAYWLSKNFIGIFAKPKVSDYSIAESSQCLTGNNAKYLRFVWEVDSNKFGRNKKWLSYAKGGAFRKWYGNLENVINWSDEAINHYRTSKVPRIIPEYIWYKPGITWGFITTTLPSFRVLPEAAVFDVGGSSIFFKDDSSINYFIGLFNTKLALKIVNTFNPTINFQLKDIRNIPTLDLNSDVREIIEPIVSSCLKLSQQDWDSMETSWGFNVSSLLSNEICQASVKASYELLRTRWREMTHQMQLHEEENNHMFIKAYGLQDELKPDVPLNEITLTCNPHYRYAGEKTEEELEALLLADTMRELVSYAVGCMFGRYSLDKPGLILANQGETLEDYLRQVPEPSFPADDDNVIPMLDGDWFTDDIAERFRQFLRVAFGETHYEENLQFIEKALGKKGKPQPIRDYFLKEFYSDHVKRYKKRPIYWLFSSPKGTFNALIYLHRYRPDTVSVVLNGYLRDFRNKLAAHLSYLQQVGVSATASQAEKTRANKEIDAIKKQLQELDDYERDVLYPLATEQVPLDLDDGVKVNYLKLGSALKKIVGLDAKEED